MKYIGDIILYSLLLGLIAVCLRHIWNRSPHGHRYETDEEVEAKARKTLYDRERSQ